MKSYLASSSVGYRGDRALILRLDAGSAGGCKSGAKTGVTDQF